MSSHLTQDTLYAPAGTPESMGSTLVAVPVLAIWLYGTMMLTEGRSGGAFTFFWTLVALGVTGMFSLRTG